MKPVTDHPYVKKFAYSGKHLENWILFFLGIFLSIFMIYEIYFTNDRLFLNGVLVPPLLSVIISYFMLLSCPFLSISSFRKIKNKDRVQIVLNPTELILSTYPEDHTVTYRLMSFSKITTTNKYETEGIKISIIGYETELFIDSTKFSSYSEFVRFKDCLLEYCS